MTERLAPPQGRFGVILADPPWKFENWSDKGTLKNASHHYRCLTLDELKALGREIGMDFICTPDAVLVMWGTWPMLDDCRELMRAWGFKYKTGGAWGKTTRHGKLAFGPGYIYREASELWLLGTRGEPKRKCRSVRNFLLEQARGHSRKPDKMYHDVERLFPGPYLEMFGRQVPPEGWTAWGDEVGKFGAAA